MKKILWGTLGYLLITFIHGFTWHLVFLKDFYEGAGPYNRPQPLFAFGVAAMLIQGVVLSWVFPLVRRGGSSFAEGLKFAGVMGLFMYSLTSIAFVAKTQVASIPGWLGVQALFHVIQFALTGVILGLVYRDSPVTRQAV